MSLAMTKLRNLTQALNPLKHLFRRHIVIFGTLVFLTIVLAAILANIIIPYSPQEINVLVRLEAPSTEHLFGTDHLGRDIFSRVIAASRVSLAAGIGAVVISTIFGILVGVITAYFSRADRILMRIMDGLMAFPVILLAIALMAALGPSLVNVIIALSVVYTPRTARIVRGAALVVKETAYVEAAEALGAGSYRKIFSHILPNCLSPVIVQATFTFAYAVQAEAALSFLGAGVPPEIPSWGLMLNESRLYMTQAPWMMIPPGVAIALTVLSLNAIGDGLRDFLDPHYRDL
jgi:peptide/nickel transport system permease protein